MISESRFVEDAIPLCRQRHRELILGIGSPLGIIQKPDFFQRVKISCGVNLSSGKVGEIIKSSPLNGFI
jgi:hypothetical protein